MDLALFSYSHMTKPFNHSVMYVDVLNMVEYSLLLLLHMYWNAERACLARKFRQSASIITIFKKYSILPWNFFFGFCYYNIIINTHACRWRNGEGGISQTEHTPDIFQACMWGRPG